MISKTFTHVKMLECESTNDEAWKHFNRNHFITTLISAEKQNKGRGRQGRKWESDHTNASPQVIFSLLFESSVENLTWVPLICGIASAEIIEKTKPSSDIRLKWPNDLYVDDKKLGGILCESKILSDDQAVIVAGIGINLFHHPEMKGSLKAISLLDPKILTPKTARKLQIDVIKGIAFRILHWNQILVRDEINIIKNHWLKFARLEKFEEITTHDDCGNEVRFKMQGLDSIGRALGKIIDKEGIIKNVVLDQPLS